MLLRLTNDAKNNKEIVDKIVSVQGLPDSIFFADEGGKKVLRVPWEADAEKCFPRRFIDKCAEWVQYDMKIPAIDNTKPPTYRATSSPALRLDMGIVPGEEAWRGILRFIESKWPRGVAVPEPKIVGTKRDWMLDHDQVPVIDLRPYTLPAEPKPTEVKIDDLEIPDLPPVRETARTKKFQKQKVAV